MGGHAVQLTTPDGQQMQVVVPFGVMPGQTFAVLHGSQDDLDDTTVRRGPKTIKLSSLNGHVGTVAQIIDSDTAKVCVHGMSGTWELAVKHLAVQPRLKDPSQASPTCVITSARLVSVPSA